MSTVLIAVGDRMLRAACVAQLERAGHTAVALDRPLALLALDRAFVWDVLIIDGTDFGRDALSALPSSSHKRIVGLGSDVAGAVATITLPLTRESLLHSVASMEGGAGTSSELRLDAGNRVAAVDDRRVVLTRTEFRLLQLLAERRPQEASLAEVLEAVWGITEGKATSELVRVHVRNLRGKLASIGLPDAVRSRRGRGYALVTPATT